MNKRNLLLLGLVGVALAQLAVPASMIIERERILRTGTRFTFKTQPVDPADVFRGRYVYLRLEPDTVKVPDSASWKSGQRAYAVLGTDTNGFATVTRLEKARPAGETSLPVRVRYVHNDKDGTLRFDWQGLDHYYMTERQAPAAEAAYREHSQRTRQDCAVTVRVRGSMGVIEDLLIANQPVHEWLKEHPAK